MKKRLTLCIVREPGRVLLGMKKRGFGSGRFNGFGGKIEADESVEDAAHREMREEADLVIAKMEKCGLLEFTFESIPDILEVHVFRVEEYTGTPRETEEMAPAWFDDSLIPFETMWADDRFWFPLFLQGKKFTGRFHFDTNDNVVEHELSEVDDTDLLFV